MTMKKQTTGSMGGKIGAAVAAGAAAAAGYYFYASPRAKQHRDAFVKWASALKEDVVYQAERVKNLNAESFGKIVDAVASTYEGVRSIDAADLKRAVRELKANWKTVQREIQQAGRAESSRAKVVGKRVLARSKKTVKRVINKATAAT
jgi:hypothetical protein